MSSDFNYRFSSEYLDIESGLVYYNWRYYTPELGKWISRDPIGEKGGRNLFAFCRNSPNMKVDMFGLHCRDCASEFEACMDNADSDLSDCRNAVADQARDLYNSLWDSAESLYNDTMKGVNHSLENMLGECNKIDRSTLSGTIKYGACKVTAYAAEHLAAVAAATAFGIATGAIAGEIAAFETGRYGKCGIQYWADTLVCKDNNRSCVNSYGKDAKGCPCK